MKDFLLDLVSKRSSLDDKLNIMREYLQAYALRVMHDEGFFRTTAFVGGTALRFLYNLPRFSEDLDFSRVGEPLQPFAALVATIKKEFALAGYDVSVTYNDEKTVQHAFIRFAGLMYDAGISPMRSQKFSIKIEIDTKPPAGARCKTDIVNKYFPVSFLSYDLSSLFAGKVHALFSRKYAKGRDYFDLGWYLSRWKDLAPNFALLENALRQTGWQGAIPTEETWRRMLGEVVMKTDWVKVSGDVGPFLERRADAGIFTKDAILALING